MVKLVRGIVKDTGYPIDGQEMLFGLWKYDKCSCWHLYDWSDLADKAVMRTYHQMDELYDDIKMAEFENIWKSGGYEAPGTFVIELDQLDVLEVITGEA